MLAWKAGKGQLIWGGWREGSGGAGEGSCVLGCGQPEGALSLGPCQGLQAPDAPQPLSMEGGGLTENYQDGVEGEGDRGSPGAASRGSLLYCCAVCQQNTPTFHGRCLSFLRPRQGPHASLCPTAHPVPPACCQIEGSASSWPHGLWVYLWLFALPMGHAQVPSV